MRFFIPGTHPALSLAELAAVLGPGDYSRCGGEAFLVDTARTGEELQERLGGIVKIGRIVGELPRYNLIAAAELLSGLVLKNAEQSEGKIIYGLSVYEFGNKSIAAQLRRDRQRIGLEMKKRLKAATPPSLPLAGEEFASEGEVAVRSVRYVDSKEPDLSAVIVIENGIIESGGEFVLLAASDRVYVGQTEAVQDYKEWGRRDFGRPAADPMSGMLPPKLARMMVNLSTNYKLQTTNLSLLDPFCGSGTVLMEGGLVGFNRLIGNDIETKAVADTKKNLEWNDQEAEMLQGDAGDIADRLQGPINAVVTEPFLGPPRVKKPSVNEAGLTIGKLMTLYKRAFTSIYKVMGPGSRCVVAFPVFEAVEQRLFMPVTPMLKEIGYKTVNPVPPSAPEIFKERTPNGGFLYRRPDAIVSREIITLEK